MAKRTIVLKGFDYSLHKEAPAAAAITPGYLLERTSSGEYQAHSTAAGSAAPLFARENDVFGQGIDTDYASGDQVLAVHAMRGAEINALVAAGASAITDGDYLESAGDGTLRVVASSTGTAASERAGVVARAIESVDNSGGTAEARIEVEVL